MSCKHYYLIAILSPTSFALFYIYYLNYHYHHHHHHIEIINADNVVLCKVNFFIQGSGRKQSKHIEAKAKIRNHVKVEYDVDMKVKNEGIEIAADVPKIKEEPKEIKISPVKRKGKSIHTNKVKREKSEEDTTKWEPENWRELLQNIKAMREDENAPVDSQGCERTADETETPEVMNYFCSCNCYSEILILFLIWWEFAMQSFQGRHEKVSKKYISSEAYLYFESGNSFVLFMFN